MMHLLLLLPSSALSSILFIHSWRNRGKRVTLVFFASCFTFGVLRGNLIYYICKNYLDEKSLPYLIVKPTIKLWNASLQECIGWVFALYLCWSTVEWVLTRQGRAEVPLYRLIGLSAILMGTVAYAVEAAASGTKWWIWVLPYKNPFFADVPLVGIIAWISVAFDFLGPFLLIYHKAVRGWWSRLMLISIFPFHMLIHTRASFNVSWLPQIGPPEIWHWLMLCLLVYGIALGGPEVIPWPAGERGTDGKKSGTMNEIIFTLIGFVMVLGSVHLFIIEKSELVVSMLPLLTGALFFNPVYGWIFCLGACLLSGIITGGWSFTLVPLLTALLFSFGSRPGDALLSLFWRKKIALAVLLLSTISIYLACRNKQNHYDKLYQGGMNIINAESAGEFRSRLAELPSPPDPGDAGMYNLLADMAFGRRNHTAARVFLERVIICNSDDPHAYSNLAIIYYLNNDYPAAVAALEKGLSNNPINLESYYILGELYTGLDSLQKAEMLYRRGLEYFKNDSTLEQSLQSVRNSLNRDNISGNRPK